MQIDWLSIYQDYPENSLPMVGEELAIYSDIETGEVKKETVRFKRKRGSYDSSITVRCDGTRIAMSGNPSRWGQRDSLFGLCSISDAVRVFNSILDELGLPHFTENSYTSPANQRLVQRTSDVIRDGAIITRVDDATNYFTGSKQNGHNLIEFLASQRHQGRTGFVYPNGCTVDWKGRSKTTQGSRYIYFKYYLKYAELGCDKTDKNYYTQLREFCEETGFMRFEISYKSMMLKKLGLDSINAWRNIDIKKLSEKYMMHTNTEYSIVGHSAVAAELIKIGESKAIATKAQGLVDSWASGNMYYMNDNNMSKTARYRYRNLIKSICGIDILERLNVSRLPVRVQTIKIQEATPPEWYKRNTL